MTFFPAIKRITLEVVFGEITSRLERLEEKMDRRFSKIEEKIEKIEEKVENQSVSLNNRIDRLEEKIENQSVSLNNRMDHLYDAMLALKSAVVSIIPTTSKVEGSGK